MASILSLLESPPSPFPSPSLGFPCLLISRNMMDVLDHLSLLGEFRFRSKKGILIFSLLVLQKAFLAALSSVA